MAIGLQVAQTSARIIGMRYQLDKRSHSVYTLRYHYVACVKYRRKVITPAISPRLKEINLSVAQRYGIKIIEQETGRDHIHILFAAKPTVQLSKFINALKSVSAKVIFREFPEVKRYLWGGHFWSPSCFLASAGDVKLEDLKAYVQSQGRV